MREILFRGKRFDGDWVEGYFFEKPILEKYFILNGENQYMVNPDTVGQYTGLKDKNNNRIFENDVVYVKYGAYNFDGSSVEHRAICGVIGYDTIGMLGVIVGWHKGIPTWSDFFNVLSLTDNIENWSIEVIGNIHDNSELLNV